MKQIENILPSWLLQWATLEFEESLNSHIWRPFVSKDIDKKDMSDSYGTGQLLSAEVSVALSEMLQRKLEPYFPNINILSDTMRGSRVNWQFAIQFPYSQLNPHSDIGYAFFGTIYLMKEWKVNWGGLYLHRNGTMPKGEWNALVPKCNTLLLETVPSSDKVHMTTAVNPWAERRFVIQIWGMKNEDE
mgnify:FL=1